MVFIILRLAVSRNSYKMFPVTLTELLQIATLLRFMIIHIHSFEVLIHFNGIIKKRIVLVYPHITWPFPPLLSQFLVMYLLYSKLILFSRYSGHLDEIIKSNFFNILSAEKKIVFYWFLFRYQIGKTN